MPHLIEFLNLSVFAFIASQAMFYLLGMGKAVLETGAESFIEFKNLLDKNLQITLRLVYFGGLLLNTIWCVVAALIHSKIHQVTSIVSEFALIADVLILLKGNQPLNKLFQSWNKQDYPENWENVRKQWFRYYNIRQIFGLIGFFSLLAGAVFR